MIPALVLVQPINRLTGTRVNIFAGSAPEATALGINGNTWEPIVAQRPRITQDLMSVDLDGRIKTGRADVILALGRMTQYPRYQDLIWLGAPIYIYRVNDLSWSTAIVEFAGRVTGAPFDLDQRKVTLNAENDRTRLAKPVLTGSFTGSGGAAGDAGLRGVYYPAGFGFNENIEWVLFDATNNIGMLDGYGNLVSVDACYEGLSSLGASVGDYSTYAGLLAAITAKTIPPGRWGTCIAQGMVGLGAPPAGRITFNATFGLNRTGLIMRHMIEIRAGVSFTEIDTASFTSLDVSVNREVRLYVKDQVQVDDMLETLALPLNCNPIITVQNKIGVTRAVASSPVGTLNRNPSAPPSVTDWRVGDAVVPTYKIQMRAARPGVVLGIDEVNFSDTIVDRGTWLVGTTYRLGNLVWLADGSSYLYTNQTATAGNPLPTTTPFTNTWWARQRLPQTAVDIKYSSGQTLDSLKPAAVGADPTAANTAAGIFGQAATATSSDYAVITGTTKPANNATNTTIYVGSGTPASPNNGDTWNDTSVTPAVLRVRVGGAWVAAANLITGTGQLTDTAGLGTTAFWTGVTGTGKPADNATRNDDMTNMFAAPYLLDRASFQGGASRQVTGTAGRPADNIRVVLPSNATVAPLAVWDSGFGAAVQPGDVLYYAHSSYREAAVTDNLGINYIVFRSDGSSIGTFATTTGAMTPADASGVWTRKFATIVIPASGAYVMPYVYRLVGTSPGSYYVGEPYLSRSQQGADVTAAAQVTYTFTDTKNIAADSSGVIAAGMLPTTVAAPKLVRNSIDISQDNSVSYSIASTSGGCVGNVTVDNTNGSTTKGLQTITTGFNASGAFQLLATVAGQQLPLMPVNVLKKNAAPPAGGGGGGGGATSANMSTGGAGASSTTYAQVGSVLTNLTVATGKTASLSGGDDYACYGGSGLLANVTAAVKWQYSPTGAGTWTDVGSAATGSAASYNNKTGDETTGSINCSASVSPAAGSYDFRLMGKINSGSTGATVGFAGSGLWGVNVA